MTQIAWYIIVNTIDITNKELEATELDTLYWKCGKKYTKISHNNNSGCSYYKACNMYMYAACLSKSIDSETFLNQNFSSRNKH
jgi:hypothetical protein